MTSPRLSEAAVRGRRLTITDIAGRAVITIPELAQVLEIGRDAAYGAVARGEWPVLRLGRTLRVPVPALLRLLGAAPEKAASAGAAIPTLAVIKTPDATSNGQSHGTDPAA